MPFGPLEDGVNMIGLFAVLGSDPALAQAEPEVMSLSIEEALQLSQEEGESIEVAPEVPPTAEPVSTRS